MESYANRKVVISLTFTTIIGTLALFSCFAILQTNAFNDDMGLLKWNPYWFSGKKYSEPVSYYGGMRGGIGGFPKRLGERSSLYGGAHQIYKWSPVYFSDGGLFGRSGNYGTNNLNKISSDGFESDDK
ncbi:uncharacterized protein LOC110849199 isoform X2 [Folsomia candida]|uniref:E3 ubiquitin-protein ligase UPL4 n=1 Tax=Folsomia candida TaxID=158441 RepID=A0A226EE32_FOLCA|nr:uncharacterized protein LOC110849199 isoform X2 [Folsomia candida]OXA55669.1 E3 ubiquitin-protein ligase UPL4 [Folsomia candida]